MSQRDVMNDEWLDLEIVKCPTIKVVSSGSLWKRRWRSLNYRPLIILLEG